MESQFTVKCKRNFNLNLREEVARAKRDRKLTSVKTFDSVPGMPEAPENVSSNESPALPIQSSLWSRALPGNILDLWREAVWAGARYR